MLRRMDTQGEVQILCRKCSGFAENVVREKMLEEGGALPKKMEIN